MPYLLGFILGYIVAFSILHFRREKPRTEIWNVSKTPPNYPEYLQKTRETAEFIHNDRAGEILKERPDSKMDDILV